MQEDLKIIGSILGIIAVVFGLIIILSKPAGKNIDPNLLNTKLITDSSYKQGSSSAELTIVEFADMQCPGCASINPVINKLLTDFPNKIYYVFRHFPLPQHNNALKGSQAVEAAGKQGKFKQMQDLLFGKQTQWENLANPDDYFYSQAKDLKLDLKSFQSDYQSASTIAKINQDVSDGNSLQVDSTPSFFLNGKLYTGQLSNLEVEVTNLLK